jgi:hypothetical protein
MVRKALFDGFEIIALDTIYAKTRNNLDKTFPGALRGLISYTFM